MLAGLTWSEELGDRCYFFLFNDILFIFRERGNMMCERNTLPVASLLSPPPGTWSAIWVCAPTGNQTRNTLLHFSGTMPNPPSHTSREQVLFSNSESKGPAHNLLGNRRKARGAGCLRCLETPENRKDSSPQGIGHQDLVRKPVARTQFLENLTSPGS